MPNDKKAYAQREKAYMQGKLFPQIKGWNDQGLTSTPTVVKDERGIPHTEPNAPVYIYDTSGPYSDPNYQVDLKKGLPRMREQWILDRNDTEQLKEVTSEYGKQRLADHSLDHLASSTSSCLAVHSWQAHHTDAYAKAGIITPEMEYVAIRENMNCQELASIPISPLNMCVMRLPADVPFFQPTSTTRRANR